MVFATCFSHLNLNISFLLDKTLWLNSKKRNMCLLTFFFFFFQLLNSCYSCVCVCVLIVFLYFSYTHRHTQTHTMLDTHNALIFFLSKDVSPTLDESLSGQAGTWCFVSFNRQPKANCPANCDKH